MGVGDGLNEQRTVNPSPESTVIVSDRTNAAATGSADGGSLSDSPLEEAVSSELVSGMPEFREISNGIGAILAPLGGGFEPEIRE
jgi:hypothetical protein